MGGAGLGISFHSFTFHNMELKYSSGLVAVLILLAAAAVRATDHYDENALYSGQRLRVNDALRWGTNILVMQPDCNLCLYSSGYDEGNEDWCTGTNGSGKSCSLFMQRDGNLVVYNDVYVSLWKSYYTARPRGDYVLPRGDYVLLLREDGILAVYSTIIWTTRVYGPPIALQMPPSSSLSSSSSLLYAAVNDPPTNARYDQNVLYKTERLTANQELRARSFRFIMQADCNLVLYNAFNGLWVSGTNGAGTGCYLLLQKDGNLVIYDKGDKALWQSGTAKGPGEYVLILQNNGNVVLYSKSIWSHKPIPPVLTSTQLLVNSTTTPRSSSAFLRGQAA